MIWCSVPDIAAPPPHLRLYSTLILVKRIGVQTMHTLTQGYKGVSVLVSLNWDRVLFTGLLIGALYAGAYVALL